MLGVCTTLQSEKARMRCINENMKYCCLNQTQEVEVLPLDNTFKLQFHFLDYPRHQFSSLVRLSYGK